MEYLFVLLTLILQTSLGTEENYDPFNFHKKYLGPSNEDHFKTRVYSREGKPIATLFVEPQYASHYIDSRHFVSPPTSSELGAPDFVSLRDKSSYSSTKQGDYFPPKSQQKQVIIPNIYEISPSTQRTPLPTRLVTTTSTTTGPLQEELEVVIRKDISLQEQRDPSRTVLKSWTSLDEEKPSWDDEYDPEGLHETPDFKETERENKKTYGSWNGGSDFGTSRDYNDSNWILVSKTNANDD